MKAVREFPYTARKNCSALNSQKLFSPWISRNKVPANFQNYYAREFQKLFSREFQFSSAREFQNCSARDIPKTEYAGSFQRLYEPWFSKDCVCR